LVHVLWSVCGGVYINNVADARFATMISTKVYMRLCEDEQVLRGWKRLAIALGVRDWRIYQLECRYGDDVYERCYQMLSCWNNSQGAAATLDVLLKALKFCRFNDVTNMLEKERKL